MPRVRVVRATVAALREVLAVGAARRAVLAVPTASRERAAGLVEAALVAGGELDLEVVPTDAPALLLPDPWLAVVPRGARWHDGRALAAWVFDPQRQGALAPAVPEG